MAKRYFSGLAIAGCVFVVLFALVALPIEMRRRSPMDAIAASLSVALGLGVVNVVLVAIGVGPLIAWMSSRSGRPLPWWAAIVGATNGLVYVAGSWLMFAEREDTLVATLGFWTRVPGELLIHLVPGALAGLAFGAWFISGRRAGIAG